jgi:uncharacterized Rmd1/YagE family protein
MNEAPQAPPTATKLRLSAHVLLLGERLDTAGLERSDLISKIPLAFRVGDGGYAVLFRYGVAVLIGLTPIAEDEVLRGVKARIHGPFASVDTETAMIEVSSGSEDQVTPGGPIAVSSLDPPRLLLIADVLAKNVALSRDEREVSKVFETIEPLWAELAHSGRSPSNRRNMLRTIGQTLLVHHRLSGRIEVEEKPDILWDNAHLERLHARLAEEYELKERAGAITRKLRIIEETSRALTDLIDTERSFRLEVAIVVLIAVEILIAFYNIFWHAK